MRYEKRVEKLIDEEEKKKKKSNGGKYLGIYTFFLVIFKKQGV